MSVKQYLRRIFAVQKYIQAATREVERLQACDTLPNSFTLVPDYTAEQWREHKNTWYEYLREVERLQAGDTLPNSHWKTMHF